jgi:predicted ATPase/transcriptional regulator with XRE-family HTH domain
LVDMRRETFGQMLRRFRVATSLTQEALADRCGLSADTIAALERGRRMAPRLSTVRAIAGALGLSESDTALLAGAAQSALEEGVAKGSSFGGLGERGTDSAGVGPAVTGPVVLPARISPLFGRHTEIESIAQELASERLVTLIGTGGVGKTRLALEVAFACVDKFGGGCWFVDLGGLTDSSAVADTVLRALKKTAQPQVPLGQQILAALPDEEHLIVFDNCEHVLDEVASLIVELLSKPSLTVLGTSREPLAIPGEVRRRVEPLPVPELRPSASAVDLVRIASVELFVDRATRADQGFKFSDDIALDVARICRRLEGLPLAIELIAARTAAVGIKDIAQEIDERIPLATDRARGLQTRQTTLLASIDWSYSMLSAQDQAAFRCLTCFAAPFTKDAFTAVTRSLALTGDRSSAGQLSRIADKSLVTVDTATGRYRVLDTIRAFATERAEEHSELEEIRDAHAIHYESWLVSLDAADASDAVLDLIDREYGNVRAALSWCIERHSPRAAAIVVAMGLYWHHRSRYEDAVALGDGVLGAAEQEDRGVWARAVGVLAVARLLSGNAQFLVTVSEARQVAVANGDALTEGRLRFVQGYRSPFAGDDIVAAYELGTATSHSLAAIASIALANGGADDRREHWLRSARRLAQGLQNSTLQAAYDFALADSLIEQGDFGKALEVCLRHASNDLVMPTTRLIGIGRALVAAVYSHDPQVAAIVDEVSEELARAWPAGGSWEAASWMAYGGLLQLWQSLLRGEIPGPVDPATIGRATRMGITPSVVRMVCHAAIDRGERPEPKAVAQEKTTPSRRSLLAASIAAVDAAHHAINGDDDLASSSWQAVLSVSAPNAFRLLTCDALEGLGCIAARRDDARRAHALLTAVDRCREEIGYRHRYSFQRANIDAARQRVGPDNPSARPVSWESAIKLAIAP